MNTHNIRQIKGKTVHEYRCFQKAWKEIGTVPFILVSRAGHVAILGIYDFFPPISVSCFLFSHYYLSWSDFFIV